MSSSCLSSSTVWLSVTTNRKLRHSFWIWTNLERKQQLLTCIQFASIANRNFHRFFCFNFGGRSPSDRQRATVDKATWSLEDSKKKKKVLRNAESDSKFQVIGFHRDTYWEHLWCNIAPALNKENTNTWPPDVKYIIPHYTSFADSGTTPALLGGRWWINIGPRVHEYSLSSWIL